SPPPSRETAHASADSGRPPTSDPRPPWSGPDPGADRLPAPPALLLRPSPLPTASRRPGAAVGPRLFPFRPPSHRGHRGRVPRRLRPEAGSPHLGGGAHPGPLERAASGSGPPLGPLPPAGLPPRRGQSPAPAAAPHPGDAPGYRAPSDLGGRCQGADPPG